MLLVYVLPLILNTLAVMILIRELLPFRHVPGARGLMASVVLAGVWSAGYAMELAWPALPAKLFWVKVQYLGITGISLAWLVFTFTYVAPPWFGRQRSRWLVLAIIPAITLVLAWTSDLHGWVYRNPTLIQGLWGPILLLEHGPWFWVFFAYGQTLMVVSTLWLGRSLLLSTRLHTWQIGTALAGTLAPWLGNLIYVSQINPVPYLDWTPFGFTAAGLLLAFSLFRFQLVKVVPIAHKMVVEGMADGVLILDLHDHIIDLNPTALQILDQPALKLIGSPVTGFLPELANSFHTLDPSRPWQAELTLEQSSARQTYDVRVSQLTGFSKLPFGRLVVLHNITQHKHEQFQLQKIRDELELRVAERTQALMAMNKQLGHELTHRRLAEKRFEEIFHTVPDAILLANAQSEILLFNSQAERVFGYDSQALFDMKIHDLVPGFYRIQHHADLAQYFDHPFRGPMKGGQEVFGRHCDGSLFPVEVILSPLKMSDGIVAACMVRDISERKKAESEQTRLLEEIRESRENLRALTSRLAEVQDVERRQIAVELHDRVGQSLTGLNLNLQVVRNRLPAEAALSAVRDRLEESIRMVEETTRQVRNVMADLDPPLLEEYGLASALHFLGEKFAQWSGVKVTVEGEEFRPRLPQRVEMGLYRIVQEVLTNVAKHAQADQVVIRLEENGRVAQVSVEDNGVGFNPKNLDLEDSRPHWGLIIIQERAASMGARLDIRTAVGAGTCVEIQLERDGNKGDD